MTTNTTTNTAATATPKQRPTYSLYWININPWTETRSNGSKSLTYLSWNIAWHITKMYFPAATYEIIRDPEGKVYWESPAGYIVGVRLKINGESHDEWFPVMDGASNSMGATERTYSTKYGGEKKIDSADMRDITDAHRRALTKAIAEMTGLGLYLWSDKPLPSINQLQGQQR